MVRRTTTGMSMNLYRYNLHGTTSRLNASQGKVMSHRQFDSYAEDPASATQAWRVRRAMINTDSYLKNTKDTYTRFQIAWSTLDIASYKLTNLDGKSADIYAASDPTASGRPALGQVLRETAESVAQVMNNAKSGENFIFSGDDELNPPFSWETTADGKRVLYYRGVNVNAGLVKSPAEDVPSWVPTTVAKQPLPDPLPEDFDTTADNTDMPALAQAFRDSLPEEGTSEDIFEKAWEEAWLKYYRDGGDTPKPDGATFTVTQPVLDENGNATYDEDGNEIVNTVYTAKDPDKDTGWDWLPLDKDGKLIDADKTADLAEVFVKNLPAKGTSEYANASVTEQAWIDYYKDPSSTLKPTNNPDENKAWEHLGRDDYGTLNGMTGIINDPNASAYNRAWAAYFKDQGDVAKLKAMAAEQRPIDLGMGLLEHDRTTLVNGTYFDRSLPGIEMLGWGVDENGDPNNVCMIMMRLGEIYENCHPETGSYDINDSTGKSAKADEIRAEAMRLLDKLKLGKEHVTDQYTQADAKAKLLSQTQDRLELQSKYLDEQRAGLEDVDLADAITQFSWDYYCYSAALKVGNQLLSQSLIDYMT